MIELKEKIKTLEDEAAKLKRLLAEYPDIKQDFDRWETVRLYTSLINPQTDEVDIHHTCGCCEDAYLLARPYKEVDGENIYSDPARFTIGEGIPSYDGIGEKEHDGWEEQMKGANIPDKVIEKVRKFFEDNKARYFYELEDLED